MNIMDRKRPRRRGMATRPPSDLYSNEIACAETVEVPVIHRNSFDARKHRRYLVKLADWPDIAHKTFR